MLLAVSRKCDNTNQALLQMTALQLCVGKPLYHTQDGAFGLRSCCCPQTRDTHRILSTTQPTAIALQLRADWCFVSVTLGPLVHIRNQMSSTQTGACSWFIHTYEQLSSLKKIWRPLHTVCQTNNKTDESLKAFENEKLFPSLSGDKNNMWIYKYELMKFINPSLTVARMSKETIYHQLTSVWSNMCSGRLVPLRMFRTQTHTHISTSRLLDCDGLVIADSWVWTFTDMNPEKYKHYIRRPSLEQTNFTSKVKWVRSEHTTCSGDLRGIEWHFNHSARTRIRNQQESFHVSVCFLVLQPCWWAVPQQSC